jgi:hypothetical protein
MDAARRPHRTPRPLIFIGRGFYRRRRSFLFAAISKTITMIPQGIIPMSIISRIVLSIASGAPVKRVV